MKKYIIIKTFIILLFATISCDNYIDVNEDPNNPSTDNINPDIALPGAQLETARTQVVTMNRLGNLFMTNWGGNVVTFAGPFDQEFRYNLNSTFYNGIWDNLYLNTSNYTYIIDYNGELNYDRHKAVSLILRAYYFQFLVDIYGDLPYVEKHQRGSNLFPKYDKDQDIYRILVSEINQAIELINNLNPSAQPLGNSDIMLNGNMNMWLKFANTVKLKLLMRESTRAESNGESQTYLSQQFATLSNEFIGLNDNVTINPGFSNVNNRQSLFYSVYGFTPANTPTNSRESVVATKYVVDFLNGTVNGVYDNRLERLYELTPNNNYFGVEQGALLASLPPGQQLSKLGPGLIIDATVDNYIFTASESLFLQAEAVQRGYLAGDAKQLFQDGIRASYNTLGASDIETYLVNSNGADGIGWDGTPNKIRAIMTQKWIALNGINGIESWIEFNRTGFPQLPLPVTTTQTSRPKRLLYPQSELSGNSANVPIQTLQSAFNTSIFWDVN